MARIAALVIGAISIVLASFARGQNVAFLVGLAFAVAASANLPTILAGIKTSAVINVGTATIAAFIGAGGFGERIAKGLALNDHTVLLAGALPAAGLALVVHALFELAERWMVRAPR